MFEIFHNMMFWAFVITISICSNLIIRKIPENYKIIVPKILLILLTFFSAFRYGIIADYHTYTNMFYHSDMQSSIEPTFKILSIILKKSFFEAQSIFVIYSCLSSFFLWKALRYYLNSPEKVNLAITFFAIFSDGGWWFSMIYIRQWLAITIFLWGSKFIIEGNFYKFIITIIIMSLSHYSSFVMVLTYFFRYIKLKKNFFVLSLALAIIIAYLDIVPQIINFTMTEIGFTRYIHYLKWGMSDLGSGIGIVLLIVLWMIILMNRDITNNKENILSNLYLIGMILSILTYSSGPIFRLRSFFEFFGFIMLVIIAYKFINYRKIFLWSIILLYGCMFLGHVYRVQLFPDNNPVNVKYQFNFKLLK